MADGTGQALGACCCGGWAKGHMNAVWRPKQLPVKVAAEVESWGKNDQARLEDDFSFLIFPVQILQAMEAARKDIARDSEDCGFFDPSEPCPFVSWVGMARARRLGSFGRFFGSVSLRLRLQPFFAHHWINVCWEDGSTANHAQLRETEGFSSSPCSTEVFPQKWGFAESVYPYPWWFHSSKRKDPKGFSAGHWKRTRGIAMANANCPRTGRTSEGAANAGDRWRCWKRWAKKQLAPMSSRTHRELGSTQLVQRILGTPLWTSQVPLAPLHFFASLWICRPSRTVSFTGGILIFNLQREVCIIREWLWCRTTWSLRQLRCPGVFSTSPWCTNLQCWSSKHRCWVSPPQCCMALSTTGSKAMALASRWLRMYPMYPAQMSGAQHFFLT